MNTKISYGIQWIVLLLGLLPVFLTAQNEDCVEAIVICTDGAVSFTATGSGIDDFANPNNDEGCIATLEDESAWYYFEFATDMPPNSSIEFTIEPSGGLGEDFDFAIYGPSLSCDSLGSPIRCSFANFLCAFCPQTGLGMGATDTTEDGATGDGFVAPMVVQPGEGFYLLLNTFGNVPNGFELTWGGSAAPYLRCDATPGCPGFAVNAGDDESVCQNDTIFLMPDLSGVSATATFEWSDTSDLSTFLNAANIENPFLVVPDDRSGDYALVLTVTDGSCMQSDTLVVQINDAPAVTISGDVILCADSTTVLSVGTGFSAYLWSDDSIGETLEVSGAGSYSVTVTNSNGCSASDTIDIIQQPPIEPTITGDTSFCEDGFTVIIGPSGFQQYEWSMGPPSQVLAVSTPGTYTLTVTDDEGCQGTASVIVEELPNPSPAISGPSELCPDTEAILDGGTGFATYAWSEGGIAQLDTILQGGTYSLTVTDDNGCMGADTLIIGGLPEASVTIDGETALCEGEIATLTALPNDGSLSFEWSDANSSNTAAIMVSTAGIYSVTATNSAGCTAVDSIELTFSDPTVSITGDTAFCENDFTVLIASSGFSSYQWSNNFPSQVLAVSSPGIYSITATDASGCEAVDSVEVILLAAPEVEIIGDTILCAGEQSDLSSDMVFPFMEWSTSSNNPSISILSGGTYSLTVEDDNGCIGADTILVTELLPLIPPINGVLNICSGDETELSTNPDYDSFSWSTGDMGATTIVDMAGMIDLTVIDTFGCEGTNSVIVSEVDYDAIVGITADFDVICEGDTAILTANGGMFSFIEWSDGSSGPTLDATAAGEYSVIAQDINGCETRDTIEIGTLAAPQSALPDTVFLCDGSVTTLNAGPGFSSYLWSTNNITQSISTSIPGIYYVTLTGTNGCVATDTINVVEVPLPSPVIMGDLSICPDQVSTLSVDTVFVEYLWSNGDTLNYTDVSTADVYEVSVTDVTGCVGTYLIVVSEVPGPNLELTLEQNLCEGSTATITADGNYNTITWSDNTNEDSIIVNEPGLYFAQASNLFGCVERDTIDLEQFALPSPNIVGELAYCSGDSTILGVPDDYAFYEWSTSQNDTSISVLMPGEYSLTVTDANGCLGADTVQVAENPIPDFTISGNEPFCPGDSIALSVPDTFALYQWADATVSSSISVYESGLYALTVTNSFGCSDSASVQVAAFPEPVVNIQGDSAYCEGLFTTLIGSAGFVSYEWSNNFPSQVIAVSNPGWYALTVTDGNGCMAQDSFLVFENALPSAAISGDTLFCAGDSLVLEGPPDLQSYVWSTTSMDSLITVNSGGQYSLSVVDSNGCENAETVDIIEQALPTPQIQGDILFCQSDTITLSLDANYASQEWSTTEQTPTISINEVGEYSVIVADEYGCLGMDTLAVEWFNDPVVEISGDTIFCPGESNLLMATSGFETYMWSDMSDDDELSVTEAGTYSVTITDSNGCQDTTMLVVEQYMVEDPIISGPLELCTGDTVQLSIDNPFVSFEWSTTSDSLSTIITNGGDFTVTVTDSNDCVTDGQWSVIENALPQITLSDTTFCAGDQVTLQAESGFANYEWSDNSNNTSLLVSTEGTYGLTVTDDNNCMGSASAFVDELSLPEPMINGPDRFCSGESITLSVADTFSVYDWTGGGVDPSISVSSPGTYTFTGTGANGCIGTFSLEVIELALPVFSIQGNDYYCADGDLNLSVVDTFSTYLWSDNSGSPDLTVDMPGTYSITVTDANNCSSSDTLQVAEIERPLADAGTPADLTCVVMSLSLGGAGTSTGDAYTYSWTGPGIDATNEDEAMPEITESGTYTFVVTDTVYSCVSDTALVEIGLDIIAPDFELNWDSLLNCGNPVLTITATLDDPSIDASFSWADPNGSTIAGATTNMLDVEESGLYSLVIENLTNGCTANGNALIEEDFTFPEIAILPTDIITCDAPSQSIDATASSDGPNFNAIWTTPTGNILNGSNTLFPLVGAGGWYFLAIENTQNGCIQRDSLLVEEDTEIPIANAGGDQDWDCLIPGAILDGRGSSIGPGFQLEWYFEDKLVAENLALPTVIDPGLYFLQVENLENGCIGTDTVRVIPDANALVEFSIATANPLCAGEATGEISIADVVGGVGPFLYSINDGPLQPSPTFSQLLGGSYLIFIEDARGCRDTLMATLIDSTAIAVDLGPDQTIKLGETAAIEASLEFEGASIERILWTTPDSTNCGECLFWEVSPLETSTYLIEVSNTVGCIARDAITIFVDRRKKVFVPNAFSPNGDGFNDRVTVFGGRDVVAVLSFKIFDRWGELVFENANFSPNDPNLGWDGELNNQPQNSAVFVFLAEVVFIDGTTEVFSGDIVLMK